MYLAYPGLVVVSILMESCVPQIILILDSYVTSSTSEDVTKVTTSRKRVRVSKSPSKLEDATNHTLTYPAKGAWKIQFANHTVLVLAVKFVRSGWYKLK